MLYDVKELLGKEIKLKFIKKTEAQPEKNWLPAYYFDICLLSGETIGSCDLRIGHNEKTYFGGNIGYKIEEKFRGNRYAFKSCQLLFNLAKQNNLNYLIITCTPDNIASSKTLELLGGDFIEIANIPEFSEMYAEGKRKIKIYKFNL